MQCFMDQLHQAKAEQAARSAESWQTKSEDAVRGVEAISTASGGELQRLLDFIYDTERSPLISEMINKRTAGLPIGSCHRRQ